MSKLLTELLAEAEALRPRMPPGQQAAAAPWFRITAAADPDQRSAELWIYDRIGPSFWDESTSAKTFVRQLFELDVDEITLRVNSPGGDFFDGLSIYNALVDHPAVVTAVVDGLAASAASFVIQSADVRRVNRAAQVMIHDASGFSMGNAAEMADFAAVLDKISDSIAGIYAARGGGTIADWRTAMRAETWYSADESVEAGLADESAEFTVVEPPVKNRFDLSVFNYAGRAAAPDPKHAAPPRARPTRTVRATGRTLSAKNERNIRDAVGLLTDTLESLDKDAEDSAAKADEPPGANAEELRMDPGAVRLLCDLGAAEVHDMTVR